MYGSITFAFGTLHIPARLRAADVAAVLGPKLPDFYAPKLRRLPFTWQWLLADLIGFEMAGVVPGEGDPDVVGTPDDDGNCTVRFSWYGDDTHLLRSATHTLAALGVTGRIEVCVPGASPCLEILAAGEVTAFRGQRVFPGQRQEGAHVLALTVQDIEVLLPLLPPSESLPGELDPYGQAAFLLERMHEACR